MTVSLDPLINNLKSVSSQLEADLNDRIDAKNDSNACYNFCKDDEFDIFVHEKSMR